VVRGVQGRDRRGRVPGPGGRAGAAGWDGRFKGKHIAGIQAKPPGGLLRYVLAAPACGAEGRRFRPPIR
jgi:hypothetical protein